MKIKLVRNEGNAVNIKLVQWVCEFVAPLDTFDFVSFQSFSLQIITWCTIFVHWLFF